MIEYSLFSVNVSSKQFLAGLLSSKPGNSIMQTNDYLNFCGEKKDDGLLTIYIKKQ